MPRRSERSRSRDQDKQGVNIDLAGGGSGTLTARYLVPAPVGKSSYRLLLPESGDATLEVGRLSTMPAARIGRRWI
ncbi:MAG: hypothetical protein IPP47_00585 [Bryobacterales bacterium]|nr:hypothetical protein [Bryobacterales bacterium]